MNEYHVLELIPAYALDCLDEEERQMVWEHVKTCSRCQAELEGYRQVVEELPLAVPLSTPPAALKTRLMQQVHAGASAKSAAEQPLSLIERLRRVIMPLSPLWSAVSLVLILVMGAGLLVQMQRNAQLENLIERPLRTIEMLGTENNPQAIGLIVISKDGEHGTIVVDRMQALDDSQQYQLWLIKDGERVSGGVFSVDDKGYGAKWVSSAEPLASYEAFGVTIEPAGGSPGPTGARVLAGAIGPD